MGNVARAVHTDGTYEYLRTKVGTLTMGEDASGVALVDGHARWHGLYEEWSQPLTRRFFTSAGNKLLHTSTDGSFLTTFPFST